jgi:hypothetical protein
MGTAALIGGGVLAGGALSRSSLFGGSAPQRPQIDWGRQPGAPQFNSQIDQQTGLLRDPYQSTNTLDTRTMDAVRNEALRDPAQASRWATMARQQQMDDLNNRSQGQLATAQSRLAMQGGLRSGARERLNQQAMRANLTGGQQIGQQIAMQDEQNRQRYLQMAPQMDLQRATFDRGVEDTNIERALRETQSQRAFDMNRYNEAMRAWAAAQAAQNMPVPQDRGLIGNLFEGLF